MATKKLFSANNRMTLRDIAFLLFAVGSAWFGLKGFLLPNRFLDGGVTGLALIAENKTDIPMAALLFALNLPFILMGRFQISQIFAFKTLGAITTLALALWLFDSQAITTDPLLVAVFGGFFIGLGIGMAIRGGGVIDGTEVLALYIARHSHFSVGQVVFAINVAIFSLAAFTFSLESALYAMLTYLSAAKTVDFILHGLDEYTAIQIFSEKNSAIIHKVLKRSMKLNIVVMQASRGDPSRPDKALDQPILYTVISRLQAPQVMTIVNSIDPRAIVVSHTVADVHGKV